MHVYDHTSTFAPPLRLLILLDTQILSKSCMSPRFASHPDPLNPYAPRTRIQICQEHLRSDRASISPRLCPFNPQCIVPSDHPLSNPLNPYCLDRAASHSSPLTPVMDKKGLFNFLVLDVQL